MYLVSAVITTHKREPKIVERALKSILNQTYKNIEIIVVDDSPADYAFRSLVKKMIEKYKNERVLYIAHESCQGACAARNTGLAHARGEFIGYLDDDDEWLPNKIDKQLSGLIDDRIAFVYCGSETMIDNKSMIKSPWIEFFKGEIFNQLILRNFVGSTSFPLIRKCCLEAVGGFDVFMESAQDYDVWLRLAERYAVNYVKDILVRYHIHDTEQISKNYMRRVNGLERLNEKNKEYLIKNKNAWHIRNIQLAPEYAGNGEKAKAWKTWFKASFKCPFYIKNNLRYLKRMLSIMLEKKSTKK